MKLFTIDKNEKLIPYKEYHFKDSKQEADLEVLLENNPEYFFERSKVLIIGRQVTTNLNTFIDLLGIDKTGNTVVVELKREKTPRETVAQLLEYASFIENIDYSQLNEIYQDYSGEESSLEDYHQQYFQNETDEKVSFNKSTRLIIVAQEVSKEIRQTSLFLRKKGIDIYCMEFKYFETKSGEKIISSDFVVGEEEFIRQKIQSASLPKVDEKQFLSSLNKNGLEVFQQIFEFAKQNGLMVRWGAKGFSLNVELETGFVGLFFGYPPNSVFKQSIYTGFEEITKKVSNPEDIIELYKESFENLSYFIKAKSNLKWVIDKTYSENEVKQFLGIIDEMISKIKERGLK
ncbi:MAG TPA: endonuclease NucS domain-containing protein [Candidatus Wunengus sp. YC61]|uniref:endonuclease NucS domain-containing protein n=1 Tax=Candidatus Wunengus sp. YC61 TaxID=3367698 RepID=UPI004024BC44